MENQAPIITLKELKEQIAKLEEQYQLPDTTKVFLDTGWDSVQEIAPDALSVAEVQAFVVEDPLNKDRFVGYSLKEKAAAMQAEGPAEQVLLLRNLY